MSKGWTPKNWDEVCKRNAGRRKLHMRKRTERAHRILGLLDVFNNVPELQDSSYGWLSIAAEKMDRSLATASRDFALTRRIRSQFMRMFGREFKPGQDFILWTWDLSHYGFCTRETYLAGFGKKLVGKFPFLTRSVLIPEEAYGGFTPEFWTKSHNSREFLVALKALRVR
jgi:hypothetical protein